MVLWLREVSNALFFRYYLWLWKQKNQDETINRQGKKISAWEGSIGRAKKIILGKIKTHIFPTKLCSSSRTKNAYIVTCILRFLKLIPCVIIIIRNANRSPASIKPRQRLNKLQQQVMMDDMPS